MENLPKGGKVGKNNWRKIEIDVDYGNKTKGAPKNKGRVNGQNFSIRVFVAFHLCKTLKFCFQVQTHKTTRLKTKLCKLSNSYLI